MAQKIVYLPDGSQRPWKVGDPVGPKEDLTGQKFGKLTVIRWVTKDEIEEIERSCWECICDCGNITYARTSELTKGHKKSCGCSRAEIGPYEDLAGQKFGRLTAIYYQNGTRENPGGWFCECECGNTTIVSAHALTSGRRISCGCILDEPPNDLTGKTIGKLTVIELFGREQGKGFLWRCICECGNEVILPSSALGGKIPTRSCGCLIDETRTKHGMTNTPLYSVWQNMLNRCYSPNSTGAKDYYERGIIVCDEWHNFINFYNWAMENGYDDSLTLDRIEVNGNYEPNNCRWADLITQANNKRNNVFYEFNGESHTLAQWERITGINQETLRNRIKFGWPLEDVFTYPPNGRYNGMPTRRMKAQQT